jgi:phospholipid/cholesterol/gamma-HCH transport system substrate-binding protein
LAVTRSLSRTQAVLLGVATLAGLALAAVGLFAVGSRQWVWADTFRLRAGFRQINGVEAGTEVRVLGRSAGTVEEVELPAAPSGAIVLHLRLDGRLRPLIRADASAQIVAVGMVGGKVVEIDPGSDAAAPAPDGALIATRPATELGDLLAKVGGALQDLKAGQGSLGKLLKEDEAYQEFLKLLKQGRGTMASLQQDADAIKDMPLVRGYVTDTHRELVRPDCARHRKTFAEADLFEPGQAVLTAAGRDKLDEIVPWLNELKIKGSEVVVVSYARPGVEPDLARTVTLKQSTAVCDYLTGTHSVQKMGWFSWSRRVVPLGRGADPPPAPEPEKLPLPRTEVIVFVPQN